MAKCALVIGAILLDVVGQSEEDQQDSEDKIGEVHFSVGGVAFNIAVNLTQLGHKCQLFTCLRRNSPISALIKTKLKGIGVGIDFVIEEEHIPDATFMAMFCGDKMTSALTSSPIERTNLLVGGKLKSAIEQAETVIVDTNLSPEQIRIIHGICSECGVSLCIVSASDAKVTRLIQGQSTGRSFALVAMNEREARLLGILDNGGMATNTVLRKLAAEQVLLSMGAAGAKYIDVHGEHHLPAPNVRPAKTLGAGDALFSAVCSCLIARKRPYAEESLAVITEAVSHVLSKDGPNMGDSRIAMEEPARYEWLAGLLSVIGVIGCYGLGLTVGLDGVAQHWTITLATAALLGGIGAWIHNISTTSSAGDSNRHRLNIVSGLIVGCAAAIVGSLPSLVGGDLVDVKEFSPDAMAAHFISSSIIALAAGIGLSRAVERLIAQALA